MAEGFEPRSFHVMAKPTGSACNLSCRYCFFLEKQRLYPGEQQRMSVEVLHSFIRQYIEAQQVPEVTLSWQGGEPTLMGLDFFRQAAEIAEELAPPGVKVSHTLQTNGILIDREWCDFLGNNNFLVGLSLDGPREMHDAYRLDGKGRPTYDRVMEAARMMQENGVDFNVLCSVHAANQDHPVELYEFLRDDLGVDWIQFIPIVERINDDGTTLLQQGNTVTDRSVDPVRWGDFLAGVFREWLKKDVGKIHINIFESAFASWVGERSLMCIFDETCGNATALEYNGDLYSCDHFVEPGCLLGNILDTPLEDLVESEKQRRFGDAKRDALPGFCRDCSVLFACRGECPKNRFISTPDGEPGLNYLCQGYRNFFYRISEPMDVMARLYRSGRSPAEVMDILEKSREALQHAFKHTGRNDPCPCGSGKKFKNCHGR